MANYTTNADLVEAVLFAAREPTDGSSYFLDTAVRYLNRAYQALWTGGGELNPGTNEVWWWLEDQSSDQIDLDPLIQTTVTTVQGSSTVTFGSTPDPQVDNDVKEWNLKITGDPNVYLIITDNKDGTAVLYNTYKRTSLSGADCYLWRTDYDLDTGVSAGQFIELTGPMTAFDRTLSNSLGLVYQQSLQNIDYNWPRNMVFTGTPKAFAFKGAGTRRVRFSHTPVNESIIVEYHFTSYPSDIQNNLEEVKVPREWRRILSDYATGMLLIDKNDDRSQQFLELARQGVSAMARSNRVRPGRNMSTRLVRPAQYNQGRHWRETESGGIIRWY